MNNNYIYKAVNKFGNILITKGNLRNAIKQAYEKKMISSSSLFDKDWYREKYLKGTTIDPVQHYLGEGWKSFNSPSPHFSTLSYLLLNPDVEASSINPLLHFIKHGKSENRIYKECMLKGLEEKQLDKFKEIQDIRIAEQYSRETKNLIIYVVPEQDYVGGGVMSICSIAKITKEIKDIHKSEVIICTAPSINTFPNYTQFETEFDIFRFEQIMNYFTSLEKLVIHVPEVYYERFMIKLKPSEIAWLQNLNDVTLNFLNQNDVIMPSPEKANIIRKIIPNLTMTCAHKQYCTKQMRSAYSMPVHLFSASNMVSYKFTQFDQKENLLVYSPDEHPSKDAIICKIKKEFPDLKLVMIENMTYSEYRNIISRAKWMITFGEGLDGYYAESIRSGAISFAAYNNIFFNASFQNLPNIYDNYNQMYEGIVKDIKRLDNAENYSKLNEKLRNIDKKEYDDNEYVENIKKYYLGEYTYPFKEIEKERIKRVNEKPLISIVVMTYNGEKFLKQQLDSLANLTYPNKEIIISDDNSKDDTVKIIKEFSKNNKITFVQNKGKRGLDKNFANAVKYIKGDYFATCDQDDIWLPNKLETLLEFIDDFDLVHGAVEVIDSSNNRHPEPIVRQMYEVNRSRTYQFNDFIYANHVLGCTTLARRNLLNKTLPMPEGIIYHDWWIVLNAIKNKGVNFVPKVVIKYRQHETNTAKLTYNSSEWFVKKQKFNNIILDKLSKVLTQKEKKWIKHDSNWCKLYDFFKRYMPNHVETFFDVNYHAVTDEMLSKLSEYLNKKQ